MALLAVEDVRIGRARDLDVLGWGGRRNQGCSHCLRLILSNPEEVVSRSAQDCTTSSHEVARSTKEDSVISSAIDDIEDRLPGMIPASD